MIHSIDDKHGSPWLTITAETYDEWQYLRNMFWDIAGVNEEKVFIAEKNESARQVSMRIDKARTRREEEEYYCG